jgi:hypothetical protein
MMPARCLAVVNVPDDDVGVAVAANSRKATRFPAPCSSAPLGAAPSRLVLLPFVHARKPTTGVGNALRDATSQED